MVSTYNRSFYKETGYKVTDEPLGREKYSKTVRGLLDYYHEEAKYGNPDAIISELIKLVEEYPDIPGFKNYLYAAYKRAGRNKSARKILEQTVKDHPDYLFGRTGLAEIYIDENKPEEAIKLLGGHPFDIRKLESDEILHYSAFFAFYGMAVNYELIKNNLKEAERLHKMLFLLDSEHPTTKMLASIIMSQRLTSGLDRIKSSREKAISVKSFPTVEYEKRSTPPAFEHEEIRALYQNPANDLPLEEQEKLLALPRETLIQDLEKVVKDSIHRYNYYRKHYREWNEEEQSFIVHAVYLLAHLEAEDSLPVVLDMLRQGEEFLDYWFSDSLEFLLGVSTFMLGKHQLEMLQQYVLEPNQYYTVRLLAAQVAAQVSWHYPERRKESVEWFTTVADYLLEHPSDKKIIDTDFISFMVLEIASARLYELEDKIVALYEKGWIEDTVMGNLEKILTRLKEDPDPSRRMELPQNLNEFYTREYLNRKPDSIFSQEVKMLLEDNPYQDYLMRTLFERMPLEDELDFEEDDDFYDDEYDDYDFVEPVKPVEPFQRKGKKVGRNDPCPCGSGRKYKKCCGKP